MKRILLFAFSLLLVFRLGGQALLDSVVRISEVTVIGYLETRPLLNTPSSLAVIDSKQLTQQNGFSFVPAFNTISGVRMEERSPGSYRLSLRGSLLRSPFGVRNVKMYIDEIPLTDAGGNSYFNSIDAGAMKSIEILKGPDGSIFGANSGGVVILHPSDPSDSTTFSNNLKGGSYSQFHEQLKLTNLNNNQRTETLFSFQQSAGYRDNSALKRFYGQLFYTWKYAPTATLKLISFVSDLDYKTPGGLTLEQFNSNPRAARPATAFSPGAAGQKAGVHNKTALFGIVNTINIVSKLKNVTSVFGSITDFKNPFITNFEQRKEKTIGLRSYFEWNNDRIKSFTWKFYAGGEFQRTFSDIKNYGNIAGEKDTLQSADDITSTQYFYFGRFSALLFNRLTVEVAMSVNYYNSLFNGNNIIDSLIIRKFSPELMPRFAVSYKIVKDLFIRATISRGYSPPTVAEIRSSDQVINTSLNAEKGWNYEAGIRFQTTNGRFLTDLSVYRFELENAIVRRTNDEGAEFFVNAGGTIQNGIEAEIAAYLILPRNSGAIRSMKLRTAITNNNFIFNNYQQGNNNYSGNQLTGVPQNVVANSLEISFPGNFYGFLQHFYTDKIPLNDANTEYNPASSIFQVKIGWRIASRSNYLLDISAGADNITNEKYSLGNDLNAFGGRYYNAAPGRNFFGGIRFVF